LSLSYSAATGRLQASDNTQPGDPVMFDTNRGLLFVDPVDVFSGSIVVPARTASSQGVDGVQTVVDVQEDYFIGLTSSPGSKYVRGMIRTQAVADGEMFDGVWRQASGTHLDAMDGVSITTVPQSDLSGFKRLATLRGLTFFVNELGHLVLRERAVARARDRGSPPASNNRTLQETTVSYELLVGSFFGADFTARPGVQFRGWNSYASGGASYSGSLDLGYEYAGRKLALIVHSANADPDTLSLSGIPFTKTASIGGATFQFSVWEGILAAGTSDTVSLSFPSAQGRIAVDCYAIANAVGVPTVYYAESSSSPTSVSVSVSTTQAAVAAVSQTPNFIGPTPTVDWVGALGQYQITTTPAFSAAVVDAKNEPASISAGWLPTTATRALFVAVWS
jgi:hypothetical protein